MPAVQTNMRKVILNTLLFIAGFTLVFASLGATASILGQYLILYKTYINIIGGILIIVLGLHLAGIYRIGFLEYEKRFQVEGKPMGLISSFLIGGAFAFGWTPCIGPILSSILLIAANQNTVFDGILLLVVYSAGLGIPFLITGIAFNYSIRVFKVIKRNYRAIELVSGLLLLFIGILIATNQFTRMSSWLASAFGAGFETSLGHQANMLTAIAAGFLSFISPCVLPLVPAYISYISGVSIDDLKGSTVATSNEQ
jgi:cytochrome c-type biogenesis protein